MSEEDPLAVWSSETNRLTIAALARNVYIPILSRAKLLEDFVTWLLAGTGATAGLFVANLGAVSTVLGRDGTQWFLYSIVGSLALGLVAKSVAIFVPVGVLDLEEARRLLLAVHENHHAEREKIEAAAIASRKSIPPNYTDEELVAEVTRPFPRTARWLFKLVMHRAKEKQSLNSDMDLPLRAWRLQIQLCTFQLVLALVALLSVAWFASR